MWKLLIPFVLLVAGCASVSSSSERTVVIRSAFADIGKATVLAEKECAKYDRKPRLSGQLQNNSFVFDCER